MQRLDVDTIEAPVRIDFDGDYEIHFGLQGERGPDAKPVKLAFYMDGKLLQTINAETKPSKLVYFDPYSEETDAAAPDRRRPRVPRRVPGRRLCQDAHRQGSLRPQEEQVSRFDDLPRTLPIEGGKGQPQENSDLRSELRPGVRGKNRFHAGPPRLPPPGHAKPKWLRSCGSSALAKSEGESTEQGIQLAIQAMLVSPNFLFRIEHDSNPTDPTRVHPVSDVELASRLSYFLWSSMPDEELLSLAEAGKLHDPATVDAQVKRMLADERSAALADNFAGQWLELRNLDVVKPDPQKFPAWGPELRDAMKTETRLFFDSILRENRPISDFLDARYTFLNEKLAKFYGIEGVTGPDFRRVELTTDQRGGLLGQARRSHRLQLSHAHQRRHSRQVHSAKYSGRPAPASACRRSTAR